jgi:hypothetical protein
VQAGIDVGGQQLGANITNLQQSDNGLLFVDNVGALSYRSKAHLASDTVVWFIGMNVQAGQYPFMGDVTWENDPQRVFTAITVNPYSPDGASLAGAVPSNAAAVSAAQKQFGVRPLAVTSYLQSSAAQASQANWLFAQYGTLRRRVAVLTINAATHPAAWPFVAGANIGDLISVYDAPFSQPATTGTYRITHLDRVVSYGANGSQIVGSCQVIADAEPTSYWS